jgi:hypothetical protein
VTDEAVAAAVCRILSTAKTRQYVVTARAVMRELGAEMQSGRLRAVLRRYGFVYTRVGNYDVGKYVVDVESARRICEKILATPRPSAASRRRRLRRP